MEQPCAPAEPLLPQHRRDPSYSSQSTEHPATSRTNKTHLSMPVMVASPTTTTTTHKSIALQLMFAPKLSTTRKMVTLVLGMYLVTILVLVLLDVSFYTYGCMGHTIGITSCVLVLAHAFARPHTRRHPNSLLLWRTLLDLVVTARLLWTPTLNHVTDDEGCLWPSLVLQICEMASEGWLFCASLDLYLTLTNPLTSFKRNYRFIYLPFVTSLSISTALVLVSYHGYGRFMYASFDSPNQPSWCWVRQHHTGGLTDFNPLLWVVFYVPMLVMYGCGMLTLAFSVVRLRRGLPQTQQTRLVVLLNNTVNLIVCTLFWVVVWVCYVCFYSTERTVFKHLVYFFFTSKGVCDLGVWVIVNEFTPHTDDMSPQANKALVQEVLHYVTLGIREAIRDQTDRVEVLELEPVQQKQVFMRQFVENLLLGNVRRAKGTNIGVPAPSPRQQGANPGAHRSVRFEDQGIAGSVRTRALSNLVPWKEVQASRGSRDRVHFRIFCPSAFRRVRQAFAVDSDTLLSTLKKPIKERISEGGASHALFFFSSDQRFIVKSMTSAEAKFWKRVCPNGKRMADEYADFVTENPHTYLCRVFGVYALVLYGKHIYFFIMENLFKDSSVVINEVYDIKGSWVNRNTKPPTNGEIVTCRHCNQKYRHVTRTRSVLRSTMTSVVHTLNSPGMIMGLRKSVEVADDEESFCPYFREHQPTTVFKDNDLKYRLRLKSVREVVHQLIRDSDFLCNTFHTMDYSLLIGVHKELHTVHQTCPANAVSASEAQINTSYYFCIIDMLQTWTLQKRLEMLIKMLVWRLDAKGVSAVPPKQYRERFQAALRSITNFDEDDQDLVAVTASSCAVAHTTEDEIDDLSDDSDSARNSVHC